MNGHGFVSVPLTRDECETKRETLSNSFSSRLLSMFCIGSDDSIDDVTTSGSSDGQCDSTTTVSYVVKPVPKVMRTVSSIENLVKANRKISFMTNYTLILGIRTLNVRESWDIKVDSLYKFPIRSYAGHSKRGQCAKDPNKKNQDVLLMMEDEASKSIILACMDGHGPEGHLVAQGMMWCDSVLYAMGCDVRRLILLVPIHSHVAQYVKENVEKRLCSHPEFRENVQLAITETIANVEKDLFDEHSINSSISGTTFVMAVVRGSLITVANIGDSRAMLVTKAGPNKYEPVALSVDHKPDNEEEHERISSAGGRVMAVTYRDGSRGPARVWRGDADSPGLAMSRSVGDRLVHDWGVVSTPSFIEHEVNLSKDCALVVASDGLWNVSSNKEVVKHVMCSREPSGAVGLLIRESHNHWVQSVSGYVDDTTVAVAFFNSV